MDVFTLPDKALTAKQRRLKAKHGTPRDFAAAVYRALGEISLAEADTAIATYLREWKRA